MALPRLGVRFHKVGAQSFRSALTWDSSHKSRPPSTINWAFTPCLRWWFFNSSQCSRKSSLHLSWPVRTPHLPQCVRLLSSLLWSVTRGACQEQLSRRDAQRVFGLKPPCLLSAGALLLCCIRRESSSAVLTGVCGWNLHCSRFQACVSRIEVLASNSLCCTTQEMSYAESLVRLSVPKRDWLRKLLLPWVVS